MMNSKIIPRIRYFLEVSRADKEKNMIFKFSLVKHNIDEIFRIQNIDQQGL